MIREMPKDFFPETLDIKGEHGRFNLACSVPVKDGKLDLEGLVISIDRLRLAFWQVLEFEREGLLKEPV